ncbi:DUF488 family protein [Carnobacterium maltaromaticum]|uniref:DUF488 domain-containing protein n=1 Tax=Carnobacterium maltaromaticum TaxID=2751 RepID=UPI00298A3E69|nr:DUF488 family protein [Carnobacterium maltaromaticum]MDW5525516.1 DUF488 family protein [Carnobacterium maltaromaticum]
MTVTIKRAYEPAKPNDGYRILVDRLWPRGMSKEKEHLDLWLKDIAPSTDLRKRYGHDPAKFPIFKDDYIKELQSTNANKVLQQLVVLIQEHKTTTLVYGAKDEIHNNAIVLRDLLLSQVE